MMSRLTFILEGNEKMSGHSTGGIYVPCACDGCVVTFDADVIGWWLVGSVDEGIAVSGWAATSSTCFVLRVEEDR
jgi:hypothetical protein